MQTSPTIRLSAAVLACVLGATAKSQSPPAKDDGGVQLLPCPSCDSSTGQVKTPVTRIRLEMPPPQVVVQAATSRAVADRPSLLQRCGFLCKPAPVYGVQYATPVVPVQPMAPMVPAAPAFSYPTMAAPMAYPAAPSFGFNPMMPYASSPMPYGQVPAMSGFTPMAFAPMPMVPFAAAPQLPQAPAAPQAPPAPTQPGGQSELNEVLKKMSTNVELLTKMVNQQTKILEYHENRLDSHQKRLDSLEQKSK